MFLSDFNKLGWAGSIVLSIVVTLAPIATFRRLAGRAGLTGCGIRGSRRLGEFTIPAGFRLVEDVRHNSAHAGDAAQPF